MKQHKMDSDELAFEQIAPNAQYIEILQHSEEIGRRVLLDGVCYMELVWCDGKPWYISVVYQKDAIDEKLTS